MRIDVKTPCGRDFETMKKEGQKRFCDACKTHVHDLSSMKRADAKELLASSATEGLCVRFLYDERGNAVFADELVGARSLLRKAKRAAAATVALALPMTLNACMGAYVPPEPPAPPAKKAQLQDPPPANAAADAGAPVAPVMPVAK
jgi:hypothetical protein